MIAEWEINSYVTSTSIIILFTITILVSHQQQGLARAPVLGPGRVAHLKLLGLCLKMITASPFTKPYTTGCGTSRMNLPSRSSPMAI
jgi:hypothetical protein